MSYEVTTIASSTVTTLTDRLTKGSPVRTETQEYFVNMGPQHPSTHGVLRLVLRLEGETVLDVVPVLGYIHRGIEKIGEHQTYRQFVHLSDRMDYLSALSNNWAVSMAIERAAGVEVSERAETVRTILAELQRVQSHQLWWGVFGMDMGAFTPFLHAFRDRERITDIFEQTIGGRLTMNYIQPGGLMEDLHPDFVRRVKEWIVYIKPKLEEYDRLLSGNTMLQSRLRDTGSVSSARALQLGASGPVLRASGLALDLRKTKPYGVYEKVEFNVPVGTVGDCWDRYWVRLAEIRESVRIVEQLIDNIPEGKHCSLKPTSKIKLPAGRFHAELETARGILGVFIVSDGKESPYRIHMRTPCFNNLWTVTEAAPGAKLADLVAILASLDLVIPDIDR